MQIIRVKRREPKHYTAWQKAVLGIACLVSVWFITNLFFYNYGSLSAVAWSDYLGKDDGTVVFVGNSFAERGFDPIAFEANMTSDGDTQTGSAYNIATPGQSIYCTKDAVSYAIAHGAKRIVFGVGVQTFTYYRDANADAAYYSGRYCNDPLGYIEAIFSIVTRDEVIGTPKALTLLFPWVQTPVLSYRGIFANVIGKLEGKPRGEVAQRTTYDWYYVGNGYGNFKHHLSWMKHSATSRSVYGAPTVDERCYDALADIAKMCKDSGVSLVVVATPHPDYDTIAYGQDYKTIMSKVEQVATDNGALYLDFNMAKIDDLTLDFSDFNDFEHMTMEGAASFSGSLCKELAKYDAGQDISQDFYSYDDFDSWVDAHIQRQ